MSEDAGACAPCIFMRGWQDDAAALALLGCKSHHYLRHDEAGELEVGSHDIARQLHHHLRESDMNPCYPALDTVAETGEMNGGLNVGGGEGVLIITVLAIFSPCAVESWQVANNQSTEKQRKAISDLRVWMKSRTNLGVFSERQCYPP